MSDRRHSNYISTITSRAERIFVRASASRTHELRFERAPSGSETDPSARKCRCSRKKGSTVKRNLKALGLNSDGDLNRRAKLSIRAAPVDVPQKSSRGETPMTFLININDRGYYMRDAYYSHCRNDARPIRLLPGGRGESRSEC